MTMQEATRGKALGVVETAQLRVRRLFATGPNPFDYWIWADETITALGEILGPDAADVREFTAIVRESGRTADQRGVLDNMTLNIHGPWGIHARLHRAEPLLERLHARLAGN